MLTDEPFRMLSKCSWSKRCAALTLRVALSGILLTNSAMATTPAAMQPAQHQAPEPLPILLLVVGGIWLYRSQRACRSNFTPSETR